MWTFDGEAGFMKMLLWNVVLIEMIALFINRHSYFNIYNIKYLAVQFGTARIFDGPGPRPTVPILRLAFNKAMC